MEDKDNVQENSGAGTKGFKLFTFGKDGSSLPRHLGSSGFTCSIICFILSFCYYTFLLYFYYYFYLNIAISKYYTIIYFVFVALLIIWGSYISLYFLSAFLTSML